MKTEMLLHLKNEGGRGGRRHLIILYEVKTHFVLVLF